jgi:hypothetical protein
LYYIETKKKVEELLQKEVVETSGNLETDKEYFAKDSLFIVTVAELVFLYRTRQKRKRRMKVSLQP